MRQWIKLMKESRPREIILYSTNGKEPFTNWLETLDTSVIARIKSRLLRLSLGNYGDYKVLSDGVKELRLQFGAGYRIYFAEHKNEIVVLLCGGDKRTQNKDIKRAIDYWENYKETKNA